MQCLGETSGSWRSVTDTHHTLQALPLAYELPASTCLLFIFGLRENKIKPEDLAKQNKENVSC